MAQLGEHQGENFAFEFVEASTIEEFALGYRRLATRVDILVALGPEIASQSGSAVREPPSVMVAIGSDPLVHRYVTSLARPTGNVTGLSFQEIQVAAKRVQFIKNAFPRLMGAIVFWDAGVDQ